MRGRALLLALLLASPGAIAQDDEQAQAERKLAEVRSEIARITAQQRELESRRDEAAAAVREADVAVAETTRALDAIDADLAKQGERMDALRAERDAVAESLATQRETLAALLRSAYAIGRHHDLKLLLAQDRLDRAARALAYSRYFQRGQIARIESLLEEMSQLAALTREVEDQRAALAQTRAERAESVEALEAQRDERRALLAQIESQHRTAEEKLAVLARDEQALVELLERLKDVFADIPEGLDGSQPFAQNKGRMPMPAAGKVLTAYAGTLPDGRRSKGWLIDATAGDTVRAISHGRVAYAEWLRGYGLIAIVDHGDGYMSLYARNDALLVEAGDWVQGGTPLARAGNSGGQAGSGLYFELRHDGEPVDPASWIAR